MNHDILKTCIASLIAIVLLYYGAAWAVLRCFHDEDHAISEATLSVADLHDRDFLLWSRDHANTNLDCMGPNYRTETLAGSSAPSKLKLSTTEVTSRLNDFLTLQGIGRAATKSFWLSGVIEPGSPLGFLIDSPRYLFLSILRV